MRKRHVGQIGDWSESRYKRDQETGYTFGTWVFILAMGFALLYLVLR